MLLEREFISSQPAVQDFKAKFGVLSYDFIQRWFLPLSGFLFRFVALINAFLGLYPTCIWGSISEPCLS